jgi:prevent-host-death family protein
MTVVVGLPDAKQHFAELVEQAAAGEEVIFVKNGVPVVKLVAVEAQADYPVSPIETDVLHVVTRVVRPAVEHRPPLQSGREDPASEQVEWALERR